MIQFYCLSTTNLHCITITIDCSIIYTIMYRKQQQCYNINTNMNKLTNKHKTIVQTLPVDKLSPQRSPYNRNTVVSLSLIKKHIPTGVLVHKLYKYRNIT